MLPFITEITHNFHSSYFDCRDSFQLVVDSYRCIMIAGSKVSWVIHFSDNNQYAVPFLCFDAVYVSSPVIIIVSTKKLTNKYTEIFN